MLIRTKLFNLLISVSTIAFCSASSVSAEDQRLNDAEILLAQITIGPIQIDPTNPVNPVRPKDPVGPKSPLNPLNPTNPLDPTDPTNPLNPDNWTKVLPDGLRLPEGVVPDEKLVASYLLFPEPVRAIPGFDEWFSDQIQQTGRDINKGVIHLGKEAERGLHNVGEAIDAAHKFLGDQFESAGESVDNAAQRVREGKLVDAWWHFIYDPYQFSEKNAAKMFQRSSLLRTVGSVAASAYGGPAGAAAFAAWYTYRATGDAELALRTGAIVGAVSYAQGEISSLPDDEVASKAILAGTVTGLGVAAAGGDEDDVREAFLKSGAMVLVQDGYRRAVNRADVPDEDQIRLDRKRLQAAKDRSALAPDSQSPTFCMSAAVGSADCAPPEGALIRDENGKVIDIDWQKAGPEYSHPGKFSPSPAELKALEDWSKEIQNDIIGENGPVMTTVAAIPGMNAMSLFHDRWAILWGMEGSALGEAANVATIVPATILVYTGTEGPLLNHLVEVSIESRESNAASAEAVEPDFGSRITRYADVLPETVFSIVRADKNDHLQILGRNVGILDYQCTLDSTTTSYTLNGASENRETLCSVIKAERDDRLSIWHAHNDENYCDRKLARLLKQATFDGMTCFERFLPVPETEMASSQ